MSVSAASYSLAPEVSSYGSEAFHKMKHPFDNRSWIDLSAEERDEWAKTQMIREFGVANINALDGVTLPWQAPKIED